MRAASEAASERSASSRLVRAATVAPEPGMGEGVGQIGQHPAGWSERLRSLKNQVLGRARFYVTHIKHKKDPK